MKAHASRLIDRYADGCTISASRVQKAEILAETIGALFPGQQGLEVVDFGCADGAVPVLLLRAPLGNSIQRITGITLLNYNDLPDKSSHTHERFVRVVGDLDGDLDGLPLPWGACDAVTATAFFHYLRAPETAFSHAFRLLKPGGYLFAGLASRWQLAFRRRGIPGFLAPNNYVRHILSLDAWGNIAAASGFTEVSRQAVQWFASPHTAALERSLRRRQLCRSCGWNYLVVYRKPAERLH